MKKVFVIGWNDHQYIGHDGDGLAVLVSKEDVEGTKNSGPFESSLCEIIATKIHVPEEGLHNAFECEDGGAYAPALRRWVKLR